MAGARTTARSAAGRVVVAFLLVAAAVLGLSVAVNLEFNRRVDAIPRVDVTGLAAPSGSARNFLLIGSDSREFVGDDPAAQETFGTQGDAGGRRSDALMIVHTDADGGFVVSVPRDLWVEIPGLGASRINAAFNEGPSKVVETIEVNFGIPIHHFLEVDFAGFAGIVDAIGGVSMFFSAPARDEVSGLLVPEAPACVVLDGAQALAFVRSRSFEELVDGTWVSDPTGDIGRIGRQQAFVRRLVADTIAAVVARPLDARQIGDATLEFLTTDSELEPNDMRSLLRAFREVDPGDPTSLEMITMPWTTGPSQGGQSVLYLEQPAATDVIARLRDPGSTRSELGETLDPASVRARVLNGTDITGLARTTADALAVEGFVPAGTGDSDRKPVAVTEVRYRPGGDAHARTVARFLGGVGQLVEDGSIVDADVVVVIGADFSSVQAPVAPETVETSAPEPQAPADSATPESAPAPGC